MLAPERAPRVPDTNAIAKFIVHGLARYPAGIIATSDGKGMKLDSIVIMMNIPTYHKLETVSTMYVTICQSIGEKG